MPIINDSTVVASAYTTSASARPQRLSNGWIVSIVKDTSSNAVKGYVSTDNGATWTINNNLLMSASPLVDVSVVCKGNFVYLITCMANQLYYRVVDIANNVVIQTTTSLDSQTSMGACSLTINSTGTELHACWSSKNATYNLSDNIRYAKGNISAIDGSVTWGIVEQVTVNNYNTGLGNHNINPCAIIDKNGIAGVIVEYNYTNTYCILFYGKSSTSVVGGINSQMGSGWGSKIIYNGSVYAQSSPSAIFVPQSINGLANGRIWVAWHGTDSVSNLNNIRVSYSDDSGITWSTMQKLTVAVGCNYYYPSITASKTNEIFIISTSSDPNNIMFYLKNTNNVWGGIVSLKTGSVQTYPSTLYDPTINFSSPLFIYKDTAKVWFYGSWTVTTISVTQGNIGSKSDKANLLEYAITTDGAMGTITESVNGVSVGTKTLTSGASSIVGLSQAQWDDIKYGKYNFINANADLSSSALWQQGIFSASVGGAYGDNGGTTRLTLVSFINSSNSYKLSINPSYQAYFLEVNSSNIVVSASGWVNDGYVFNVTSGNKIKIAVRKTDDSAIVPSNAPTVALNLIANSYPNNTLTVTMGTDTFTYTFDKRLATSDDITSAMKAVQDTQSVMLPSVKAKLGSAIRSKGGSVNDSDSFDTMASAINEIALGRKYASGTSSGSPLIVRGLTFSPSIVIVKDPSQGNSSYNQYALSIYVDKDKLGLTYDIMSQFTVSGTYALGAWTKYSDGFSVNCYNGIKWIAIE